MYTITYSYIIIKKEHLYSKILSRNGKKIKYMNKTTNTKET